MLDCLIKRLDKYTEDEYLSYCLKNSLDYEAMKPYYHTWAIQDKELLLSKLIWLLGGDYTVAEVSGTIEIWSGCHSVRPKKLSITEAFNKMLTPDLFDYEVYYDQDSGFYYVNGYHDGKCINMFNLFIYDSHGETDPGD